MERAAGQVRSAYSTCIFAAMADSHRPQMERTLVT